MGHVSHMQGYITHTHNDTDKPCLRVETLISAARPGCGTLWCGALWCGALWCGALWCGALRGVPVQRLRGSHVTRAGLYHELHAYA